MHSLSYGEARPARGERPIGRRNPIEPQPQHERGVPVAVATPGSNQLAVGLHTRQLTPTALLTAPQLLDESAQLGLLVVAFGGGAVVLWHPKDQPSPSRRIMLWAFAFVIVGAGVIFFLAAD